jgi:hypothetical protein
MIAAEQGRSRLPTGIARGVASLACDESESVTGALPPADEELSESLF